MGRYYRPTTQQAALSALAERRWTILAGGTDHFPARGERLPDEDILDTSSIDGWRDIAGDGDTWTIPAGVTWSQLAAATLPPAFDGIRAAARAVGGPQVQNAGTIAGNLCHASPAADGVPCLLALDAEVLLASPTGARALPVAAFVQAPRRTARRPDELLTALRIHAPPTQRGHFEKLGARAHLVISIATAALVAALTDGRITAARLAIGACGPVPIRLPAAEAALIGHPPDPARLHLDHFAPLSPIDDVRAPAWYRRTAALELARRAVAALA